MEPARPYLIGVTVLILGFAWWQKLKPKKVDQIDCDCDEDEKPSFLQSKKFLGIVTVFAAFMLVFPYYSHIFYPETKANTVIVESGNIQQVHLQITGMTCTGCEEHIKHAVAELPGFIEATANYEKSAAAVKFDKSKSTIDDVIAAINETGYTVADYKTNEAN
ncbi:MAG: mercuric transport protein MerTP [Flavobacteriales bacterium]|nr:mercuric transport protein MerTP [Flavobacteriales bacterium]